MADRIVYGQQELIKALNDGLRAITLCAGIYEIPLTEGVSIDRLGPVTVSVDGTRAEADAAGMEFIEIYPEYKNGYAVDRRVTLYTVAVSSGSYNGSFGSHSGSYVWHGSMGGSFGSYTWHGSMGGSFSSGSLSYGSFPSFASGSFYGSASFGSFAEPSCGGMPDVVLGYGIDLI